MTIVYVLLALVAVCAVTGVLYVVYRLDELDEFKEDLDKYSVHLDERANRIALEEEELRRMRMELHDGQKSV